MCQLREKEMHETGKWVHALYKLKFIFKKFLKNKIITVKLKKNDNVKFATAERAFFSTNNQKSCVFVFLSQT